MVDNVFMEAYAEARMAYSKSDMESFPMQSYQDMDYPYSYDFSNASSDASSIDDECYLSLDPDYGVSEGVKVFLAVSFVLTTVVCGLGNFLLCFLIARHRRLRSVTNLLIANLAGSDALVALFCAPLSLRFYMTQDWDMPKVLCPIVGTTKNVSLYVSVNTLLVIAVDRYIGIFKPLRPRMKKKTLCVIIAAIWIVSLLVSLPTPLTIDVTASINCHLHKVQHHCYEFWHNELLGKLYVSFMTVAEFLLPFFIMGAIYLQIALQLWMHRTPPGNQTDRHREITLVRKQKTIPMLITVVVAFFLCWAPYYAYNLAVQFDKQLLENYSGQIALFFVVESIAMLNSVISTIVFFLMSPNFRAELVLLLSKIFGKRAFRPPPNSYDIDKERFNVPIHTNSNNSLGRNGYVQVGLIRKSSDTAEARI